MSLPILPSSLLRPRLAVRVKIHAAVWLARLLATRSPRRIKAVMTTLSRRARVADYAQARQARDEVLSVSARCCGPTACLPRSIAVALVCRSRGIWPTWCVGVLAAPPFLAHAWIEVAGDIVDEPVGSDSYRRFFTVGPDTAPAPNKTWPASGRSSARTAGEPRLESRGTQ